MLAVFCDSVTDPGPMVQLATELHGIQVTVDLPMLEAPEDINDAVKLQVARQAGRNSVMNLSDEEVKEFRRRFVREAHTIDGVITLETPAETMEKAVQ